MTTLPLEFSFGIVSRFRRINYSRASEWSKQIKFFARACFGFDHTKELPVRRVGRVARLIRPGEIFHNFGARVLYFKVVEINCGRFLI